MPAAEPIPRAPAPTHGPRKGFRHAGLVSGGSGNGVACCRFDGHAVQGGDVNETSRQRTLLAFQTHFFDAWCERAFRQIAKGCPPHCQPIVVFHRARGVPLPARLSRVPHHVVPTGELRSTIYPGKSAGADWDLWRGGHTDLIALHAFRAHPGYDRYWAIEYDVRFSGPWSRLFRAFEDDPADLLTSSVLRRRHDPEWYNWPSLAAPEALDEDRTLRVFLPIFRASAAMVAAVDEAYRAGWTGHCEATWGTIAMMRGLSVVDLGGEGEFTPDRYRGRFYLNCPCQVHLAPGTLIFKPALYRMGGRRDMLWHPVKPFFWRAEAKEGLRDIRRRAGVVVRGVAGWLRRSRHTDGLPEQGGGNAAPTG